MLSTMKKTESYYSGVGIGKDSGKTPRLIRSRQHNNISSIVSVMTTFVCMVVSLTEIET